MAMGSMLVPDPHIWLNTASNGYTQLFDGIIQTLPKFRPIPIICIAQ